jgi:hypothetical protein
MIRSSPCHRRRRSTADIDLHDFVERHVVTTTVVELRRAHGRIFAQLQNRD